MLQQKITYHWNNFAMVSFNVSPSPLSQLLGHLLYIAKEVAEKQGIEEHFRVVINNGTEAGQSVFHLHLHVMGGRRMLWPPG